MYVHLSPVCRIGFHEVLSSELDDPGGGSPMLGGLGTCWTTLICAGRGGCSLEES